MTDIVGFTEATVHQSRSDIDTLLAAHNRVLLPIVKRYRGRHVKSIGDALLLVFRSPTDAMLCAMAMQDGLHELNCRAPKDRQIRIRIGASVGEVRVTNNDVFGEPVNLTSRVSGITPGNEIYFSEALHMAMNKAEVPSREVGWKELKGITQPVRIYNIPRFSPSRLAPEAMAMKDLTDLIYPYGGAHFVSDDQRSSVVVSLKKLRRGLKARLGMAADRLVAFLDRPRMRLAAIATLVLVPVMIGTYFGVAHMMQRPTTADPAAVAEQPAASEARSVAQAAPAAEADAKVKSVESPAAAKPAVAKGQRSAERPAPVTARKVALNPAKVEDVKSTHSLSVLKRAFGEKKITKDEFERLTKKLTEARDWDIRQITLERDQGNLATKQYEVKLKEIQRRYE